MTRSSGSESVVRAQATAHRGDSSRFRENTLPAIRSAIAAGADFVEIDVRITSDGEVVVLHDPTLERLWGMPLPVDQVTLEQLRALGDADHRPPLLSEVLAEFEGAPATLLIDMDEAYPAEHAYRVAASSAAAVAWCGDLDGMRTIRALDPAARIWLPWDHLRMPSAEELAELAPERVNSSFLTLTRDMVDHIHALGHKVSAWTIDDELTMRWAIGIGVDTVTTNRLSRLQRITEEGATGGTAIDGLDLDAAMVVARGLAEWEIDFVRETDPGEISTKSDAADLVTDVDVAVERHVREVIGHHFPDHDFVGEEMGGSARPGVPCWYLDPVDGTANFANRIPWNAFSLGLVLDGVPLAGVVADPWRAELFEAVRGRGAKLNGAALTIPARKAAADPLSGTIVCTELANQVPWPGMLQLLEKLGERYCTMRIMGSGTMTLVGVAAGRGAGAVIGKYGAEDHVAAALIVHEAGGVVLDESGEATLFPASGGILAAAPAAADELYALWRDARALSFTVQPPVT